MFFKKRGPEVRKCPRGHILDPDWDQCPYCAAQHTDEFLDESRASHRRAAPSDPDALLPPLPTLPPLPPAPTTPTTPPPAPPPAPPVSRPPQAPPPPRYQPPAPSALDPDLTQVSRPGSLPPPVPGATPPPPADGSGPPPLVEFSDAQGRPAPAHGAPPPRPTVPSPPPPPPPAAPAPPRPVGGSLDDQTRILHARVAGGGLTIAWLVAASGALRGQDFRIQPGGARIGRLATCGVCLPQGQEFGVSKEHAEVRIGGGVCLLVDLESANGTFVNGERVNERVLQDGDRVRLGLLEFVFKSMVL